MTNRLEARLSALRRAGERGLAPYVTCGDGGLDVTLAVLRALDRAGCTCVELGLPFSDPIADGPILQAAAQRALEQGVSFEGVCAMLERLRQGSDGEPGCELPIAVMSYTNPILRHGWTPAARALARAGADALLIADLPVEEGQALCAASAETGLCPIFFVAPTTSPERIQSAVEKSRGFVYAIGRFGVTGVSTELDEAAQAFLARVRAAAGELAVAVGFGIGSAEQVRAATRHADLAIVGSALVQHIHTATKRAIEEAIEEAPGNAPAQAAARAAQDFASELLRGIHTGEIRS